MQNAETVLHVLRERGRRGLPIEGIYRQLFNPQLYLLAYGRIYSNKGAMTPGPDAETADGMTHGQDRAHHRRVASRALPVSARSAALHPEEGWEAAAAGSADGHVIPQGCPTSLWVRWWSRIRSIRCAGSGLRFCMCVERLPVACMCATAAGSVACRCLRRRPIVVRSRLIGR